MMKINALYHRPVLNNFLVENVLELLTLSSLRDLQPDFPVTLEALSNELTQL